MGFIPNANSDRSGSAWGSGWRRHLRWNPGSAGKGEQLLARSAAGTDVRRGSNMVLPARPGREAKLLHPATCLTSAPAPPASLLALWFNCCGCSHTPCELCSCLECPSSPCLAWILIPFREKPFRLPRLGPSAPGHPLISPLPLHVEVMGFCVCLPHLAVSGMGYASFVSVCPVPPTLAWTREGMMSVISIC